MHPQDCPSWEYNTHPKRALLTARVADILFELASARVDTLSVAADTREQHSTLFRDLVPPGYEYYAGHYRGELFRCLRFYTVRVEGDPRVGAAPGTVKFYMAQLSAIIRAGVFALDENVSLAAREKLRYVVALVCHVFVRFLTIHPYANGNGHMGRLIIWSIMGRYGHWPRGFPVEPRPQDPPYQELIIRYRSGDTEPLEKYILQMLAR
jgi:fido (protein-threonine AMPylation protein)